jgi:hypothetical protein
MKSTSNYIYFDKVECEELVKGERRMRYSFAFFPKKV